mgnify:CR=1 FL=1
MTVKLNLQITEDLNQAINDEVDVTTHPFFFEKISKTT